MTMMFMTIDMRTVTVAMIVTTMTTKCSRDFVDEDYDYKDDYISEDDDDDDDIVVSLKR